MGRGAAHGMLTGRGGWINENFGGGGTAEREGGGSIDAEGDRVADVVAVLDGDSGAGHQMMGVGKSKELGVLIGDAGDAGTLGGPASRERAQRRCGELAASGGDGIAVGVEGGSAEKFINSLEELVGDYVLELLGFRVNLGPVKTQHADEKQFDQAVAAKDVERELLAGGGEQNAPSGAVADQARLGQGLDHGGDGAGDDAGFSGEPAEGDELAAGPLVLQVNLLDVVFDGAGRHTRSQTSPIITSAGEN